MTLNQVYNGWRYIGSYRRRRCDKCGIVRQNCHEFIREDTPYGDNWTGYKYADEPIMLGSECVKEFINPPPTNSGIGGGNEMPKLQ